MKLKILKDESHEMEFSIEGERHTYANLLKETLLADKDTVFASYKLEHPEEDRGTFILKTKNRKASAVLKDAVAEIEKQLDDLEKSLKSALK